MHYTAVTHAMVIAFLVTKPGHALPTPGDFQVRGLSIPSEAKREAKIESKFPDSTCLSLQCTHPELFKPITVKREARNKIKDFGENHVPEDGFGLQPINVKREAQNQKKKPEVTCMSAQCTHFDQVKPINVKREAQNQRKKPEVTCMSLECTHFDQVKPINVKREATTKSILPEESSDLPFSPVL